MAGSISVMENSDSDSQNSQNLFVWDEDSKLYFHASSGFYHEPNAGWYYSTRDELYYKFENGNYVPFHSDQSDKCEISGLESSAQESSVLDEQCEKVTSNEEIDLVLNSCKSEVVSPKKVNTDFRNSYSPENHRPPSEWLEETLIELYLSGYSNQAIEEAGDATRANKIDEVDNVEFQADGETDTYELEEGEWIPEDDFDVDQSNEHALDDSFARDYENWKAQYGQVFQSSEEATIDVPAVDLWDWSMVKGTKKHGKGEITRLVGRPMKTSTKLHPSMPSGGGRLKTAPICDVHLDLVRVTTGQIYRLRNPSAKLLASLSAYDSSNPTKEWGFPELPLQEVNQPVSLSKTKKKSDVNAGEDLAVSDSLACRGPITTCEKSKNQVYRDRAAERRALHGSFGIAPGQDLSDDIQSDLPSASSEEAAAEALNMSFGAGSYARRLLEGMGWKQGEALGKTMKGLVEPIQAEGNIGSAGLGWPRGRSRH